MVRNATEGVKVQFLTNYLSLIVHVTTINNLEVQILCDIGVD